MPPSRPSSPAPTVHHATPPSCDPIELPGIDEELASEIRQTQQRDFHRELCARLQKWLRQQEDYQIEIQQPQHTGQKRLRDEAASVEEVANDLILKLREIERKRRRTECVAIYSTGGHKDCVKWGKNDAAVSNSVADTKLPSQHGMQRRVGVKGGGLEEDGKLGGSELEGGDLEGCKLQKNRLGLDGLGGERLIMEQNHSLLPNQRKRSHSRSGLDDNDLGLEKYTLSGLVGKHKEAQHTNTPPLPRSKKLKHEHGRPCGNTQDAPASSASNSTHVPSTPLRKRCYRQDMKVDSAGGKESPRGCGKLATPPSFGEEAHPQSAVLPTFSKSTTYLFAVDTPYQTDWSFWQELTPSGSPSPVRLY